MSSAKGDNVDFKQHLSANKITLVAKLCVIDIAPTLDMYAATDFDFAQAYYHWFHLIQPEPLPETMIGGNPLAYLHHKLGGWGSGGMGHVIAVHDRRLDRDIALKARHPQSGRDSGFDERIMREARITARLDHPGIVPIFDAGIGVDGRGSAAT